MYCTPAELIANFWQANRHRLTYEAFKDPGRTQHCQCTMDSVVNFVTSQSAEDHNDAHFTLCT